MRKIGNLSVVVVIACIMIAFYTGSITTYANEEAGHECVQCGKPADSHGGEVTVEHGWCKPGFLLSGLCQ